MTHPRRPPLKGGTWNLRQGRNPETVRGEVVHLLVAEGLDFLSVQEAAQYLDRPMRRALRGAGYSLRRVWRPDRSARDSAVIARRRYRRAYPRLHRLGGIGWERGKGRPGLHWPRSAQSRRVAWLRVMDCHMPPGPFGPRFPRRRAANVRAYRRVARILERWNRRGVPWVAPTDWNRRKHDPVVRALVDATDARVWGGGIDWIAGRGVRVTDVRRLDFGRSDHDPRVFVVSAA